MPKATDELLKDHKMIRKIMERFSADDKRFPQIVKTLHRVVLGHAWFEDQIFFPAIDKEPLLARRFMDELYQEHKDIDDILKRIEATPSTALKELEFVSLQLRVLLDTHFKKEEDALFPLSEKILDSEGLNQITVEMRRRQHEFQGAKGSF